MVRIAFCGKIGLSDEDGSLGELVESCAREAGFEECQMEVHGSALDLIDAVSGTRASAEVDAILIGEGLPGMTGAALLRELRDDGCTLPVVLCAPDYDDAFGALSAGVECYLASPVDRARMRTALVRLFGRIGELRADSIVMRFREGERRIRLSQVLYAETSDHSQLLHMSDGTVYTAQLSSQGLFDELAGSGLFFKAGSSYIVNIHEVRLVDGRTSMATISDGTMVTVPRRVRKALEIAILA